MFKTLHDISKYGGCEAFFVKLVAILVIPATARVNMFESELHQSKLILIRRVSSIQNVYSMPTSWIPA